MVHRPIKSTLAAFLGCLLPALSGCACFVTPAEAPVALSGIGECEQDTAAALRIDGSYQVPEVTGCEGDTVEVELQRSDDEMNCLVTMAFDADGGLLPVEYDCSWRSPAGLCTGAGSTAEGSQGLAAIIDVQVTYRPGTGPNLGATIGIFQVAFETSGGDIAGGALRYETEQSSGNFDVDDLSFATGDSTGGTLTLNLVMTDVDPTQPNQARMWVRHSNGDLGSVWRGDVSDPNANI